jgi:hypothetical protein
MVSARCHASRAASGLPAGVLGVAEVDERGGFGVPVSGLPEQVEGLPQLGVRVVEAAQPGVGVGQAAVGAGLRDRVGQPPGGGR